MNAMRMYFFISENDAPVTGMPDMLHFFGIVEHRSKFQDMEHIVCRCLISSARPEETTVTIDGLGTILEKDGKYAASTLNMQLKFGM